MTGPSLQNGPWEFNTNNKIQAASVTVLGRELTFLLKDIVVGFSVWSVVGSSDGNTVKQVGDQSPDLWLTSANVVRSTGAHSWIVLENSVTGEQILLDGRYSSTSNDLYIVHSAPGDFTTSGATTLVAPTSAQGQVVMSDSYSYIYSSGLPKETVVHGMMSADGKCLRLFHYTQNPGYYSGGALYLFEEVYNPPSSWTSTHKRCVFRPGSIYSSGVYSTQSPRKNEAEGQNWFCHLKTATPSEGNYAFYATAERYGASVYPVYSATVTSALNAGFVVSPIGLFRPDADHGGAVGNLKDIYWKSKGHAFFQCFRGDTGPREWIVLGVFVLPWDGSVPVFPISHQQT